MRSEKFSTVVISTRCITLGTMWRAIARRCGTPRRLGRLHELQVAQLQRLGAHQAAQRGPAGEAEDHAQQEHLQVGALQAGLEHLGMRVDEHLHHQHAGGDQQHVGHRGQHRVQVLHRLVDPAL